jgi:hypothetical protein
MISPFRKLNSVLSCPTKSHWARARTTFWGGSGGGPWFGRMTGGGCAPVRQRERERLCLPLFERKRKEEKYLNREF